MTPLHYYGPLVLLIIGFMKSSGHEVDKVSSFFIFGDSTVDAGNNNYINTIPENRANYIPYGHNGYFQQPTGRFSEGRIVVDFIAEYAQLPLIPPFLQPSIEYVNGVNFASAGAGVLCETNQGLVIDLKTQLNHFEQVRKTLIENLGQVEASKVVSEAVYSFSIGSNDYIGGYLGNPSMQQNYQPEEYIGMVIGNLTQAIQELYMKGGRKFAFLSLSSLGCLPVLRALNPRAKEGGCFEEATALAMAHNHALNSVLTNLEHLLKDFYFCSSKFSIWLDDRINNPFNYGFKDGVNACCGIGPYGGIFTCGGTKNLTEYTLCESPSDYVWWDSFHPTEKLHEQLAQELWHGSPDVGPYNLKQLFSGNSKDLTIADVVDDPEHEQFF
ncbi:GDSL esterase/lipase 5 [Heracleum sosnowskyi]|uniref:GDSL esterase/lipase 5 n=1 Tax=Heracleum sosnowskyi TaxID=360622 RepID=A0AAD8MQU6_9APIA|nr:GDSL esterase/lipase 5 [Heracleum sosnowskyi]